METIVKLTITTEQKIKFFEYALDLFTNKKKKDIYNNIFFQPNLSRDLRDYGFCLIYKYFFGESSNDFYFLPELNRFKPKKIFYECDGTPTTDDNKFWFPLGGEQKERIRICETMLSTLKK